MSILWLKYCNGSHLRVKVEVIKTALGPYMVQSLPALIDLISHTPSLHSSHTDLPVLPQKWQVCFYLTTTFAFIVPLCLEYSSLDSQMIHSLTSCSNVTFSLRPSLMTP